MSNKLSFSQVVERAAAATGESPDKSAFPNYSVALLAVGPIERPIDFVRLLADHGVSLKKARMILDRLPLKQVVAVEIKAENLAQFFEAADKLGVTGSQLENSPVVSAKHIREKQGLSQPDFACLYGLDVDTLKNWEQGRYALDAAARVLLRVIDRCPSAVIEARTENLIWGRLHTSDWDWDITGLTCKYNNTPSNMGGDLSQQNYAWIVAPNQRASK
jgi:putative transcriptional regulator